MTTDDSRKVSAATRDAERQQFTTAAGADEMPTDDEERLAEQGAQGVDVDTVGEKAGEQYERGANQQGEGRIP